jgi:hypothetical protein
MLKPMHEDEPRPHWRACLLDIFRWSNEDCIESIQALQVPLIAINTDLMPTEVDVFKKYAPSFQLKTVTGNGHVMMWDAKDQFDALLEESIQENMSAE